MKKSNVGIAGIVMFLIVVFVLQTLFGAQNNKTVTVTVPATTEKVDGAFVKEGQTITIVSVTGKWSLEAANPQRLVVGANGEQGTANRKVGCAKLLESANNGALLLLHEGQMVAVGARAGLKITAINSGNVSFAINDCKGEYGNNSGEIVVVFVVE